MWLRKRLTAGILAAVVAVSSMQVPAGVTYARETVSVSGVAPETDDSGAEAPETDDTGRETATDAGNEQPGDPEADGAESGETGDGKEEPGEADDGTEEPGQAEDDRENPGEADDSGEEPGEAEDGGGQSEAPEKDGKTEETAPDNVDDTADGTAEDGSRPEEAGEPDGNGKDAADVEEPDGEGEEAEDPDHDSAQVSGNDLSDPGTSDTLLQEEEGSDYLAASGVALDMANLSAEYTALDGSTITSTAQGRPKLLIFYSNRCGNSMGTIRRISQKIGDFAGVDICAIETNRQTREQVAAFQETYGCKEIVFSYDTGMINQSSMWEYVEAGEAGDTSSGGMSVTWPVIAYIDAKDRLQYLTTGSSTAEEVLSNLKRYCDFSEDNEERYTITYVLGGGTNSPENPAFYTTDTDTIILRDASRAGCRFEGWYKDPLYKERVREIARGSQGNITLYAKWSAASASEIPEVDMTPAEGNVVMGFSGVYYTESADKILNRLNEIRWEACRQGVRNPSTGKPLTEADYVPLQWSSDLEAIARLRAAEATVIQSHTRPNGERCFSAVTTNQEQSFGENLAWNNSGLMEGIEQWYREKKDWVAQTAGAVTGHYTSMISPDYHSVGVGAFRLSSGGWYAVAQEFGYKDTMDAYKNPAQGKCVQDMEVQGSKVTKLRFGEDMAAFHREGSTYQIPVEVSVKYADYYGSTKAYSGPYRAGGCWRSSDDTVATVDSWGMLSARAKGTADITIEAGGRSASAKVSVYGQDESPITVRRPERTTYKVGQKLAVKGGQVTYRADAGEGLVTKDMTLKMLSGFDSSKPGICTVKVNCGGYSAEFDTLIVEEPALKAEHGKRLGEVSLPVCEYGSYAWQDSAQVLDQVGVHTYKAVFTPTDQENFQKLTDIQVQVTTQMTLGSDTEAVFRSNTFIYNGVEQEPKLAVSAAGHALTEGRDYELSYKDNRNVGTAEVTVEGINHYHGSIRRTFEIRPAPLVIKAKDKTILTGSGIPANNEYTYETKGLMEGDSLVEKPVFSCAVADTSRAGRYDIVPGGADAGPNYEVSYENGRLTVADEAVSCAVTFDVQGHGTEPAEQVGIRAGDTVGRPEDPSAEGYRFGGWYRDPACTKEWIFETDTVQTDMTLYAKWLYENKDCGLAMQEIADVCYTGKACKPAVSVYDGETLLKAGRDYQIRYYNNVNANKDNLRRQGNGGGAFFRDTLPYVEIIGKGNYTEKVKVNFNILPVSIGDGGEEAAAGVELRVSDQLVRTAARAQKPFSSIRCGRAMREGTDYAVSLSVVNGRDRSGRPLPTGTELDDAAVPAGCEGEFLLSVRGLGNYEGSLSRTVYVADRAHLIRNARITIGRNVRNVPFDGGKAVLRPAEYDSPDAFTVKYGREFLRYNKDYRVKYRNNDRAGKAELIIVGIGAYVGEKSATFRILEKPFAARTVKVEGIEDKEYTGTAVTQNHVVLRYMEGTEEEKKLVYGTDYTISYTRNTDAGSVIMTFKGLEEAGYAGSFKKSFHIRAADITQAEQAEEMKDITVSYSKAGATPAEKIVLTGKGGRRLVMGKDYTLRYQNHKAVADRTGEKPPTVFVKGKGNYTGEFPVYFNIVRKDLGEEDITIRASAMAYRENREPDHQYRPVVKLTDGKKQLRAGVDYEIMYVNNTQADQEIYWQELQRSRQDTAAAGSGKARGLADGNGPQAVILAKEGSNYTLREPIRVPLSIYRNKLTKSNLTAEVAEAFYTGTAVTPAVKVYYQGKAGGEKILLTEGKDYTLTYGANIASGTNKGSVRISGIGPRYGGDVTVRFSIGKKGISIYN